MRIEFFESKEGIDEEDEQVAPSIFVPVINGGMPFSQTGDVGRESKLRDLFARHTFTNIWAKHVCWVDELTEVADNSKSVCKPGSLVPALWGNIL